MDNDTYTTKLLRRIYYDTGTGYKTQERFYKEAKKQDKYITHKDIKNFLEQQEEYQINKKQKPEKKLQYNITAPRGYYQADLMFYNKLVKVKANKNNSVILCLVEIATRKGYATAMKDKEAETVLKGLKKILTQIKEPVKAITTDNGSEFKGEFNKYLQDNDIKHYYAQKNDKNTMSIVERFNRTIKQFNNRYFRATKNYNWFEILDDVVYNYNHTYNNNIKGTPEDLTPEQIDLLRSDDIQRNIDVRQRIMRKIKEGDSVRTRIEQRPFDKEGQVWSDEIHKVIKPVLNKFQLSDTNKKYGINDLQILKSNKVQKAPREAKPAKKDNILKILGKAKAERANKKEGVEKKNILQTTSKRSREPSLRSLEKFSY